MPRLLSLNTYHYRRGGADVVFLEHEAMFKEMGWDTAHMCMRHPKNEPSEWSRFFVDEIEFGHSYNVAQKIGMAGKVVYSLEARRNLAALLGRFPADVAHVHCIYHHLSPSVLPLLKERGIPVVLTAHDLKIACPAYKMLNRGGVCEACKGGKLWHVVANRCVRDSLAVSAVVFVESTVARWLGLYRRNLARVVAPSNFYASKLAEWGWATDQIAYIPNYVRADSFEPAYAPGRHFLYFGRLAPEKGVSTLIRASAEAKVPLRIVGTGPLEAQLKASAAGLDVEFLGFRSGPALWEAVKDSLAVVLPSEWYENAPVSVLEAYALGKPVIGARIGGIPEMIQEGMTGLTFESGNAHELAQRLSELADAPTSRVEAMGRAAREYVSQTFTRARYQEAMLSLYRSLGVR